MERRHFEAIAEAVRTYPNQEERLSIAYHLADKLRHLNPRFDRERFVKACTS